MDQTCPACHCGPAEYFHRNLASITCAADWREEWPVSDFHSSVAKNALSNYKYTLAAKVPGISLFRGALSLASLSTFANCVRNSNEMLSYF